MAVLDESYRYSGIPLAEVDKLAKTDSARTKPGAGLAINRHGRLTMSKEGPKGL